MHDKKTKILIKKYLNLRDTILHDNCIESSLFAIELNILKAKLILARLNRMHNKRQMHRVYINYFMYCLGFMVGWHVHYSFGDRF